MKELSPAEYRTALSILAFPFGTERARMLLSGLPSSTYNLARRRIYEEGWLADLWVPEPGPCGFSSVEVRVARPSASERDSAERELVRDPECVVGWGGVHSMLSVSFRARPLSTATRAERAAGARSIVSISSAPARGRVLVYFDYAGLWARFGRFRVPGRYPQGLEWAAGTARERDVAAARTAMQAQGNAKEGSPWINLPRLPRSQLMAVERGVLARRTVLRLERVPAYEGRRLGEVILITGRWGSVPSPGEFLSALTRGCGVYPFLYAEDPEHVAFAGVGLTDAAQPGRVPVPTARRSVLRTLQERLTDLEVTVEPVEAFRSLVEFRHRVP